MILLGKDVCGRCYYSSVCLHVGSPNVACFRSPVHKHGVCVVDFEHWTDFDCSLCWDVSCLEHPNFVASVTKRKKRSRWAEVMLNE